MYFKWVMFYLPREEEEANTVEREVRLISRQMGFNLGNPQRVKLYDSDRSTETKFINAIKQECNKDCKLVVCILPNNSKIAYDAIKRLCFCELALNCQIICKSLFKKNVKSVMTKVCVQLHAKLGGEIWGLTMPVKHNLNFCVCIIKLL